MKERAIILLAAFTAILVFGAVIGLAITGYVPKSSTLVVECTDTEEPSHNIYGKGIVTYKTTSNNLKYVDSCYDISGLPFLIEYSCGIDNRINREIHYCRYGCGNGRCLKA